jgi:hypothetical protein
VREREREREEERERERERGRERDKQIAKWRKKGGAKRETEGGRTPGK